MLAMCPGVNERDFRSGQRSGRYGMERMCLHWVILCVVFFSFLCTLTWCWQCVQVLMREISGLVNVVVAMERMCIHWVISCVVFFSFLCTLTWCWQCVLVLMREISGQVNAVVARKECVYIGWYHVVFSFLAFSVLWPDVGNVSRC